MRYKVTGDRRLYIGGEFYEPGDVIVAVVPLDNEASLIDAGHVEIVEHDAPEPTTSVDELVVVIADTTDEDDAEGGE